MEDTIMNTQKLIKKLKRLNELTEDALCREWLHKLSDYEHKQFVEKSNALKEEIASLEQEQDECEHPDDAVIKDGAMDYCMACCKRISKEQDDDYNPYLLSGYELDRMEKQRKQY